MNSKRLRDESPNKSDQSDDDSNELENKRLIIESDFVSIFQKNMMNKLMGKLDQNDSDSSDDYDDHGEWRKEQYESWYKSRIGPLTDIKATKATINRFRNSLTCYIGELDKLKEDLRNSSLKAYETSSELRRKAQLKTEETIADLKIAHGFDINDDECILPLELQLEIEIIQKNSNALIEKTESYEQTLINESESSEIKTQVNKIMSELDEKKKVAVQWNDELDADNLNGKNSLQKVKKEMNGFSLKAIKEKISLLPFNAKKMDFIENKPNEGEVAVQQKLGQMKIKETIMFEKLNIFKFAEVEDSQLIFTLPSRIFEVLDNGTFVVGGYVTSTKKFHLFIYDPIKKDIISKVIFNTRIASIFTVKNKIYVSQRKTENSDYENILKLMDENLNVIKQQNTFIYTDLKYLDESYVYCVMQLCAKDTLRLFDLNLNEIKTNVVFQYDKPNESFYIKLPHFSFDPETGNAQRHSSSSFENFKMDQLVKREDKYIINVKMYNGRAFEHNLLIFNELGILLTKFSIYDAFVIDSKNNIIINQNRKDSIFYYDMNGEMFKHVSWKRPKNDTKLLKKIKIDSADLLYFTQ